MNRILVKIQWNANGAYGFSTLSRSHGLTQPFFINQDVPEYLSVCPCRIVRDMDSFAELCRNGDILEITFTRLREESSGLLSGWRETVILGCGELIDFLHDHTRIDCLILEKPPESLPALDFSDKRAQKRLREVLADRTLRRALTCALRDCFRWRGARMVKFRTDPEPHSFCLEEILPDGGRGICGGLILHEGPRGKYYSIHT